MRKQFCNRALLALGGVVPLSGSPRLRHTEEGRSAMSGELPREAPWPSRSIAGQHPGSGYEVDDLVQPARSTRVGRERVSASEFEEEAVSFSTRTRHEVGAFSFHGQDLLQVAKHEISGKFVTSRKVTARSGAQRVLYDDIFRTTVTRSQVRHGASSTGRHGFALDSTFGAENVKRSRAPTSCQE